LLSFARRGKETPAVSGHDTLIAKGVSVQGSIHAQGVLRIDGKVSGRIVAEGDVIVGQEGLVSADVSASNVIIAGELQGNVAVSGRLHILSGGRLFGDARVGVLVVEEGGIFKGECEMDVRRPGEEPVRIVRKVDNSQEGTAEPASDAAISAGGQAV